MAITSFQNNKTTEGGSKGGLCNFRFCPVEWVETMPLVADGEYIDTIVFTSGKDWLTGYAAADTLLWNEEPVGNNLYKPLLKGYSPIDEDVNLSLFEQMNGKEFLVLAEDRHGRLVLSGVPSAGLKFSYSRSKGTRQNNLNGMDYEFGNVVLPWPSYYYTE